MPRYSQIEIEIDKHTQDTYSIYHAVRGWDDGKLQLLLRHFATTQAAAAVSADDDEDEDEVIII